MDAAQLGRQISPFFQSSSETLARFATVAGAEDSFQPVSSDQLVLEQAAQSPSYVLNAEILRALDQALARDGLDLDRQADPADYTPEQVANRILEFVESVVGQHQPDDPQRAGLLQQAREGIERGFQEARGILEGLGVLQGDIASNINRTYELIQNGLERLAGNESLAAIEAEPADALFEAAYRSASYSSSQTTTLVIDTQDGDRVTIEIDRQASASETAFAARNDGTGVSASQSSREASVEFSFRVEGELDDDEQGAIESLIKRIDKLSDKFFDGNMQAAFAKATKLKFDSDELAGFSLDMNFTQTYQAVSAYQRSSPEGEPVGSLSNAAALGGELRTLMEDAGRHTKFDNPAEGVAKLLHHLVRERADNGFKALKEDAMASLHELVKSIVKSYLPEEVTGQGAAEESDEQEHEDAD